MPSFQNSRAVTVNADPASVHALITDFHAWQQWSPWEALDPALERSYSGPATGVGSRYAWSGNKKVGEGSMEITGSSPERIDIALEFLRPFKATNTTSFELRPVGGGTGVTWTMSGNRNPLMAVLGALYFDRAIGKDFDKGLANLKALAER